MGCGGLEWSVHYSGRVEHAKKRSKRKTVQIVCYIVDLFVRYFLLNEDLIYLLILVSQLYFQTPPKAPMRG